MRSHQGSHDAFFKSVFSSPANAGDLLAAALPKNISRLIDFTSLTEAANSFTGSHLASRTADIIFEAKTIGKNRIQLALLIEHKSKAVKNIELQLLNYMAEMYRRDVKTKKLITPVLPIVFYHGVSPWMSTAFWDSFPSELIEFTPAFKYILIDLNRLDDETIIQGYSYHRLETKLALLIQKNIFDTGLLGDSLDKIFKNFYLSTIDESEINFFSTLMTYVLEQSRITENEILLKIENNAPIIKEIVMTTGARLRQEGRIQGREEGRLEGKMEGKMEGKSEGRREILVKLIHLMSRDGEPIHKICSYTGLTADEVEAIKRQAN